MKKVDKLKKLLFSASLWVVAGFAQAIPQPVALGSIGASGISPIEVSLPASGYFSNVFSFSLATGNSADISFATSFWGDPVTDAPNISFELQGVSGVGVYAPALFVEDVSLVADMAFTGLVPGNLYTLIIAGSEAVDLGASYTLQMAANYVPEPGILVLLLFSLFLWALLQKYKLKGKRHYE